MSAPTATSRPVVLIVEDDPLLRELTIEVVEEAGFVAIGASNADQAVGLLESRRDIAVLFTDINMPGSMDGLELAHAVTRRWPSIRILVASGRIRLLKSDLPPDCCFLPKPYCAAAVIAELRSVAIADMSH